MPPPWYAKRLDSYPPPYEMVFTCERCGHVRSIPFEELIAAHPDWTVGDVAERARCSFRRWDHSLGRRVDQDCGGRADVSPQPNRRAPLFGDLWRSLSQE